MRRKYQLDYMKDLKILGNRVFFGKFESLGPEKLTASATLAKFEEQVYGGPLLP